MSPLARCCQITLILASFLTPVLCWKALQTLQVTASDPLEWVAAEHPVRLDYRRFTETFEGGDVLVASWPGCTANDQRLKKLAERLRELDRFKDRRGNPWFERVISGGLIQAPLFTADTASQASEAAESLRSAMTGKDGTTCLLLVFTRDGIRDRQRAVARIREILTNDLHIAPADQHLAGPVMDGHDVDVASSEALNLFAPIATAVIFLLCWWSLKRLRLAMTVFGISIFSEIVTLALVTLCGDRMNPLMIIMPPLILVLGVSSGIHLVNYYLAAVPEVGPSAAPMTALRAGWRPCVLSLGTTAIGLASLLVSDLQPIREFGLYAALGAVITLVVLLCFLPGSFCLWPVNAETTGNPVGEGRGAEGGSQVSDSPFFRGLMRHHGVVTVVSLLLMLLAGAGLRHLQTSVRIQTFFREDSRILRDYEWIETHIGPLVPIEVLIRFKAAADVPLASRLELVRHAHQELLRMPLIRSVVSAVEAVPTLPLHSDLPLQAKLQQEFERRLLATAGRFRLIRESGREQIWRISARVSALEDIDYGRLLTDLRKQLLPLLSTRGFDAGSTSAALTITGAMPVVHEIQRELLRDLFDSFLMAFLVISVIMIVLEQSVTAGLLSMIPNVFPMLLFFGVTGWIRQPMDIGLVMTASLALGMAIDGTLHFLAFFHRELKRTRSRHAAVLTACVHCAPALIQSAVSCAFGLLMFGFSSFLPTSRFAWTMLALTLAALGGDLLVLPALLAGPVGRCFERRSAA